MANALNKSTKRYLTSVNTPDYPAADWIINPDMSAVDGFESKYWVITGDVITLMDLSERNAVDAAELSAKRDSIAGALDYQQDVMVEFFKLMIAELNRKSDKTNAILAAAANANNLATFKTDMGLIANEPTRTMAQLKTALRAALDN